MWEKWKNKIKKLFQTENDMEYRQDDTPTPMVKKEKRQDLQARVTYQYPKNKSFRFPVIPDDSQDNYKHKQHSEDLHNKKRTKRRTDRHSQERDNSVRDDQPESLSKQNHNDPWENNKIYKKSDEPFKVSEIPSPIYGFQRPKKKEKEQLNEDIPAYLRRNDLQQKNSQHHETVEMDQQPELVENNTKNESQENTRENKESPLPVVNEVKQEKVGGDKERFQEAKFETKDEQADLISTQKSEDSSDKGIEPADMENDNKQESEGSVEVAATAETATEEIDKVGTSNASPEKVVRKENQDKPVFPFNVIMTPSDKRNLRRRKREQKNTRIESKGIGEQMPQPSGRTDTDKDEAEPVVEAIKKDIPYHLLNDPIDKTDADQVWVEQQQNLLEETLKHFNVKANVVKATQGPSVTRFEVQPELGVKVSKIKNLSDDLKLNMAARDIRIEAPIPGKNTVGIEIPNQHAQMVGLQEIFETNAFKESKSPLSVALGLSIEGEPKVTDIQKMPHGLIAGATGSGKSVCINTMLVSLLYKASHEDVKILLIDPKMVELAPYNGIPHLVTPVITDVKAATQSLKWAVAEMEDRYGKFVHEGVRNIEAYNKKVKQQNRMDEKMPFIVIVIDELADLMMTAPHDVEDSISRIAQKARACGIHLIVATQRPSVDVITGLIKANIPTRIAFSVSSQVDSRTIIDVSGAEKLLGKGDMLFVENGAGKSVRLQGPFVSDEEIERVTNFARSIAKPNYLFNQEDLLEQIHVDEEEDELLQDVIDFILLQNSASTSMIQRRFKIGYNRAARLMDTLEYKGIISGQNGSKPREVLISKGQEEM